MNQENDGNLSQEESIREIRRLENLYRDTVKGEGSVDHNRVNKFISNIQHINLTPERREYVKKYAAAYASFVKKHEKSEFKNARLQRRQLMDYFEAKKVFWNDYLSKAFQTQNRPFDVDEHNAAVIEKLLLFFIQDRAVEHSEYCQGGRPLDLKKGICLFGTVGGGKTTIMERFSLFTTDQGFENAFSIDYFINTLEIATSKEGVSYIHRFKNQDWCFDELIPQKSNSMGNSVNVAERVIDQAYKRFIKSGNPAHFTSNAYPPELKKLLGFKTYSRLEHMCNFVFLDGPNRRKEEEF